MANKKVKNVVVLGAGVMGGQIAALLACAGHKVRLLDLPLAGDEAGRARQGLEKALVSRPPAFYLVEMAQRVELGSMEDLACVGPADWVIEAVVEESAPKQALLARLEPYLHDGLVISSNTSGLSIAELARGRSPEFCRCFLGVHFFNPPRYMKLVEVIPGPDTDPAIVQQMVDFLTEELGKGVVRGRDTPNFIGNRLWTFAVCDMLQRMERDGLRVAEVDALTGPLMGRPQSATLRVCDIVGLDTVAHVAETSYEGLPADPWRSLFALPAFYRRMLEENLLGAKVNAGFYRKAESGIEALDLDTFAYQPVQKVETLASALSERSPARRLRALWDDPGPWGQLGRAHLTAVLAYAAEHAADIAGDIVQIDQAMRWGFNWALGPFELWDLFGIEEVVRALEANQQRVPDLAAQLLAAGETHFYREQGAFSPTRLRRESWQQPADDWARLASERAIWSNAGAYLVELDEGMGALVFSGKMNALGPAALEAVHHAVDTAPFAGLVLAGAGSLFSVGADLKHVAKLVDESDWLELEAFVAAFQEAVQALRSAPFPVVAVLRGLVLGGGCEFALGADARVATTELGMGLVETKVGLIPGSGGCMEMARRGTNDIASAFETIFAGNFSDNAFQAQAWGLLGAEDEIAFAEGQLLKRAVVKLRSLLAAGYCASTPDGVEVTGDEGLALLHERLDEGQAAGQLSEHDVVVGRGLARVLTGGGGARRQVEERHLLDLEREVFLQLCSTERTRQRIAHMLHTGKPLRN